VLRPGVDACDPDGWDGNAAKTLTEEQQCELAESLVVVRMDDTAVSSGWRRVWDFALLIPQPVGQGLLPLNRELG
jgi:hypothetical protein